MAMLMYHFTPLELLHIQSYHQLCFYQSASSFLSDQISPDNHDRCSSTLNWFIVIIVIIIMMMIIVMMIALRITIMIMIGHVYDIDYDG